MEGWTGDSIGAVGSSAMKRKFHVAFLGGKGSAMIPTYPTILSDGYHMLVKLAYMQRK